MPSLLALLLQVGAVAATAGALTMDVQLLGLLMVEVEVEAPAAVGGHRAAVQQQLPLLLQLMLVLGAVLPAAAQVGCLTSAALLLLLLLLLVHHCWARGTLKALPSASWTTSWQARLTCWVERYSGSYMCK